MGVDLGELALKHAVSLQGLSGKIVAIDAFNIIYQFLASIRQEDGTPLMDYKGNVTAHLSGLFYRNVKLMECGIKPVYVFDGKPHELKGRVHGERSEAKKIAESGAQAVFFAGGTEPGAVALWKEMHSADPRLWLLGSSTMVNATSLRHWS